VNGEGVREGQRGGGGGGGFVKDQDSITHQNKYFECLRRWTGTNSGAIPGSKHIGNDPKPSSLHSATLEAPLTEAVDKECKIEEEADGGTNTLDLLSLAKAVQSMARNNATSTPHTHIYQTPDSRAAIKDLAAAARNMFKPYETPRAEAPIKNVEAAAQIFNRSSSGPLQKCIGNSSQQKKAYNSQGMRHAYVCLSAPVHVSISTCIIGAVDGATGNSQ
jgi:hypothetical protein